MVKFWISILGSITCYGATWNVSQFATNGDGTLESPWSLSQAITNKLVLPGDTVLLQSGIYNGSFVSRLSSSGNPIIVRADGRVVIDGNGSSSTTLDIEGSRVWYWGLEIINSDTNRVSVRSAGVSLNPNLGGAENKLINCIIHDTGNAVFVSSQSTNAEVYGCIIYNNGWQGVSPDRGHGHGIYAQNYPGTNRMLLMNNAVFRQFGWGLHLYGEGGYVSDIDSVGNVSFENGAISTPVVNNPAILIQSGKRSSGNTIIGNICYGAGDVSIGSGSPEVSVSIQRNVFANCGLRLSYVTNATITDNIVRGLINWFRPDVSTNFIWDRNRYYEPNQYAVCVDNHCLTWPEWRTSFPSNDVNSQLLPVPVSPWAYLSTNLYNPDRATVTIVNWPTNDTVSVSCNEFLSLGDSYSIRNASDYFGDPVKIGVYDGAITFPMTNLSSATPIGMSKPPNRSPLFNVFLIDRIASKWNKLKHKRSET